MIPQAMPEAMRLAMPQAMLGAMHVRTYVLTENYSPRQSAHAGYRAQGGQTDLSIEGGPASLRAALAELAPALITERNKRRRRHPVTRNTRTEERAPIPPSDRRFVYQRDGFECSWCTNQDDLTVDHIKPWSAGGTDHVDNLRTLCWSCNARRGNARHIDDGWTPLPVTFDCVDCAAEFALEWADAPPTPLHHPSYGPAFCWWHRHPAIGSRARWFTDNAAEWDHEANWHREIAHV